MNKKNKRKILARVCAIVGVFAILASLCLIPAGAWEKTDIPFYNYFDASKVPTLSSTSNAVGISSVNPNTGDIRFKFHVNQNDTYLVDWNITNLKLKDVCPDMVAGEVYVFSQYFASQNASLQPLNFLYLKPSADVKALQIDFGTPFLCTDEMLNSYVMLCAGNFPRGVGKPLDKTIESVVRLWVNKDTAQTFEPYDLFKGIQDEAYKEGYEQGKTDGYDNGYNTGFDLGFEDGYENGKQYSAIDSLMVSRKNTSLITVFRDEQTGEDYTFHYNTGIDYPFNGYSFNTALLADKYKSPPNDHSYLRSMQVLVIPENFGQNYVVGQSVLTFTNVGTGTLQVQVLKKDDLTVYSRTYYLNNAGRTTNISFEDFGLEQGDIIDSIAFTFTKFDSTNSFPPFSNFSFAFADTRDNAYILGVEEGKSQGYFDGQAQGYKEGMEQGLTEGYDQGYTRGYDTGYNNGDEDGYYRGRTDESKEDSFFSMISSVIDAPIQAFRGLFNFNVLGIDMSSFVLSIITIAVCITVIKVLL